MIYHTKQEFIQHLRSLEMSAAAVVTNDHGSTVHGFITHTLPGVCIHTVQFAHAKDEPDSVAFTAPEWHWPAGLPDVRHGTQSLTRDDVIFLIIDYTPIREYGATLALPG